MKAVVCTKYGSPLQLQIKEVEKPKVLPKEVLVKIYYTAVNDYEWSMVRGKPYLYRLMFGLLKPKKPYMGMELSGIVEKVGSNVTRFKEGDEIFGDTSEFVFASFAEYISVDEKALEVKPKRMSFEEAASLPHASMLAYQAFNDVPRIGEHQKILVNGAGGGVGLFALQLAKLHKAEVTGVDTGGKLATMKEWGYDRVIDYKQTDFAKEAMRYDFILDAKSTRSPFNLLSALTTEGAYVSVGGRIGTMIQILLFKGLIHAFTKKKLSILALKPNKGLSSILDLYEQGAIKFQIDGPYPLEKAGWAIKYFGEGKHKGKVILEVCKPG